MVKGGDELVVILQEHVSSGVFRRLERDEPFAERTTENVIALVRALLKLKAMTPNQLRRLIRAAGREPVERDTLYNVIAARDSEALTA